MAVKTKASKSIWPTRAIGVVPAAGAEATIVVPADEVWEIESVEVQMVADAGVANRDLQIEMTDPNGVEISSGPIDGTSITASQTVKYHLAQYGTVPADTTTNHYDQIAKEPKVILGPGSIINTVTLLQESGDQYTAISVMANKFIPTLD